jgi:hypothetical protein
MSPKMMNSTLIGPMDGTVPPEAKSAAGIIRMERVSNSFLKPGNLVSGIWFLIKWKFIYWTWFDGQQFKKYFHSRG